MILTLAAGSGGQFLCGTTPSIADLSSCEELFQAPPHQHAPICTPLALTATPQLTIIQKDFSKYPRVAAWLSDMRALPEYDAAHSILQASTMLLAVRYRRYSFLFARAIVRLHGVVVFGFSRASCLQKVAKKASERAAAASKL